MGPSVGWFLCLSALAGLAFSLGWWLGRGPGHRAWLGLSLGLALLALWTWLLRNPSVAVHAIPVRVLTYIEGTAAVPVFMLVAGIAWSLARLPRQRKLTGLAVALGVLFFLNGGLWMLQTTPSRSLGKTPHRSLVLQSQDYSCVAAACATALNQLGVRTSEAEMAELTQTRPATGATTIRAMDGLNRRLSALPVPLWRVELVQPTYEQLAALPTPLVAPLQFEPTRRHMVVIEKVDGRNVWLADPTDGLVQLRRDEFEAAFTGEVLVFRRME